MRAGYSSLLGLFSAPRSLRGFPVVRVLGALSSGGRTPGLCAGPADGGPATGASADFSASDFAVVVRSVDGESQPHPQSRDRNDNILWISRFALPALEENEVLAGGFPKSQRMSCFMFDSTIDTDGDRSIVLKHRKADFGYASVSFVAKRFDQL